MKLHFWYLSILFLTALTLLFVYLIPSDSLFAFVNYVFGIIFVAFMPGYCLVNILFAAKENKIDPLEGIVLSVALSFGIVGLSGLFLGLSPIGINFNSIRLSLGGIVSVLASVAYTRKRHLTKA